MIDNKFKAAPMDTTAKVVTILLILFAGALPFLPAMPLYAIVFLPVLVFATWLFSVNGFTLREQQLIVHRPFWNTEIQLPPYVIAKAEPEIKNGLFKTMGNGGMFGYTGGFRNKELGNFKAYATNWNNAISIRCETTGFCIVVTPEDTQYFLSSFR